jgi:hypothetical protein
VEREREPVTPVDRQQLLVGHGAECMVGQEGRAGSGATGTAISSMGFGPAKTKRRRAMRARIREIRALLRVTEHGIK